MNIQPCSLTDIDQILQLYAFARQLQQERKMVTWPWFDRTFLENEIMQQRQWKLVEDGRIVCNWAISYEDKEIWGEKDMDNAVYIHRIAVHKDCRGNRFIDHIVHWAKAFAAENGRPFVRLDTLGNNTRLIQHYTSAGFTFLGMHTLTHTETLPLHYQQEPNCCLFEIAI